MPERRPGEPASPLGVQVFAFEVIGTCQIPSTLFQLLSPAIVLRTHFWVCQGCPDRRYALLEELAVVLLSFAPLNLRHVWLFGDNRVPFRRLLKNHVEQSALDFDHHGFETDFGHEILLS